MPFITLNTNWSNLAYFYNTVDANNVFNHPDGAWVNVTRTQKPQIPKDSNQFKLGDDGFIRGGISNVTLAVKQDVERLSKYITKGNESTKGYLFLVKQAGLQLANPRLDWRGNPEKNAPLPFGGFNRQFTGVGTALSVAGTAFGLHFEQPGLLGLVFDKQKYGGDVDSPLEGVAYINNFGEGNKNSSVNLKAHNRLLRYTAKLVNKDPSENNTIKLDGPYIGGAKSVYGIGFTNVFSYYDKTTIRTNDIGPTGKLTYRLNKFTPLTSLELANISGSLFGPSSPTNYIDFNVTESPFYTKTSTAPKPGYTIDKKFGVSSTGSLDSINTINIIDSKVYYDNIGKAIIDVVGDNVFDYKDDVVRGEFGVDLVKFAIEFLNNEESTVDGLPKTDVLAFRAYIDSFTDGIDAKWNSFRYMGRGEEFYVYEGFTRDIGLSFTIHAHSSKEMAPLYSKLNYLMSAFTPDYGAQLKMRGNIAYLTVGDYLYRQPGIFTSIKIGNLMDSSWETGLDNAGISNGEYQLPRMLKVQLSYKPIHSFLPRRNYSSKKASGNVQQEFPASFITPDMQSYPTKQPDGSFNYDNKYLNTGGWKTQK